MHIKGVAKQVYHYVADIIPNKFRKIGKSTNPIDEISLPPKATTDTFEHVANTTMPKDIQEILDKFGHYYQKQEKQFLIDLYKTSPSKFDYIYKHKYFKGGIPYYNDTEFIQAVKKMPEKELVKTFDEVEELYKTLPERYDSHNPVTKEIIYTPQTPNATNLAQLTILKSHNKEAYEYLLNHPNKEKVSYLLDNFNSNLNGSVFETLTIPQIRQIEGAGRVSNLNIQTNLTDRELWALGSSKLERYVRSSDILTRNADDVAILNKYLGSSTVTEPFTAFRGNRDTGIFCSVIVDDAFARKTKWNVLKNIFKAKKVKIHEYTGQYENAFANKTDLFSYIMNKKTITLADAMQVAKYGDDSYRKQIIEMIKNSQLSEGRFKSLTFDKNMATTWIPEQGAKNTGIFENVTVTQGSQGVYSHIDNRQAEFVLNNNQKRITFNDARYDAEKDIFVIDSVYESI